MRRKAASTESSIATTIYRLSVLTGRLPDALTPELQVAEPLQQLPTLNAVGDPAALQVAPRRGRVARVVGAVDVAVEAVQQVLEDEDLDGRAAVALVRFNFGAAVRRRLLRERLVGAGGARRRDQQQPDDQPFLHSSSPQA